MPAWPRLGVFARRVFSASPAASQSMDWPSRGSSCRASVVNAAVPGGRAHLALSWLIRSGFGHPARTIRVWQLRPSSRSSDGAGDQCGGCCLPFGAVSGAGYVQGTVLEQSPPTFASMWLAFPDGACAGHRSIHVCPARPTMHHVMHHAYLVPRTSHVTPRTPHTAHRTPHLAPRTSHFAPRTSHLAPRTSTHVSRTTHHVPRTTYHVPRTTSHAPRPTTARTAYLRFPFGRRCYYYY